MIFEIQSVAGVVGRTTVFEIFMDDLVVFI